MNSMSLHPLNLTLVAYKRGKQNLGSEIGLKYYM